MSNFFYNAYLNYLKLEPVRPDNIDDIQNIQIIGYYDTEKNLWFNAWAIYHEDRKESYKYKKSKDLLTWALNLENDLNGISSTDKTIIKTIICSSKLYITDSFENPKDPKESIQLEILLSVICYLTKAKKCHWQHNKNNFAFAYIFI